MDFKVKRELFEMIATIKNDYDTWQRNIQKGRVTLQKIDALQLNIMATEDLWNTTNVTRKLVVMEKRLRTYFVRLGKFCMKLNVILLDLSRVRDSTCRMLSRTRLWKDDEILVNHNITRKLNVLHLLEFLGFLNQRYDAEWEVKEMVFREIQAARYSSDSAFLVKAWDDCSHAGGTEFELKFNQFFEKCGRRHL